MFAIGEFSQITGLTVKTLRFYHERGLLTPARIDPGTGYRFYDEQNRETAGVIVALRGLEFSLEEIATILDECGDDGDAATFLSNHRERIAKKRDHYHDLVGRIDRAITQQQLFKEADRMNSQKFEIEEKEVAQQLIAGIRMRGRYSEIGMGFSKLGRKAGRQLAGKAMCLVYDAEYREDDADFEAVFPIKREVQAEGVEVRTLPKTRCVTLLHRGPYDTIGRSYARALAHAAEQGYAIDRPTREVYHKGPGMIFKGNPKKYLTEIQLPIAGG